MSVYSIEYYNVCVFVIDYYNVCVVAIEYLAKYSFRYLVFNVENILFGKRN